MSSGLLAILRVGSIVGPKMALGRVHPMAATLQGIGRIQGRAKHNRIASRCVARLTRVMPGRMVEVWVDRPIGVIAVPAAGEFGRV